ncbi:MAG: 16S rRNA (uracil(1498)-N(3))-methyltransferase [Alloprevotella sp.]|nr:16S rRNA (uracil(1498)-N(3))-methyltransferase [Alloprevotella sp.]
MKEFHLFYAPDIATTRMLPPDESAHAVRVLRLREGDALVCTDGQGRLYDCTVGEASQKHTYINIIRTREEAPLWEGSIEVAVAPTKSMDRMEWFAEKATEIGVDAITFLDCRNSERRVVKTERVERILVSAMKQSHKARLPRLQGMTRFEEFLRQPFDGQRFICHCYEGQDEGLPIEKAFLGDIIEKTGRARVLIGPEGDFSIDEVKLALSNGYQQVTLGDSRLRTETAALAATHIMYLAKRTVKRPAENN